MNNKNVKYYYVFGVILLLFTAWIGTPYMTVAAFNYLLILYGFLNRKKNRRLHVSFVSLGILFDLALVLLLEFQRDAIATAVSLKLSALNQAHIFASSIATTLYIPMMITGYMIIRHEKFRIHHRRMGNLVILFRTLGLILMYSMIESLKSV